MGTGAKSYVGWAEEAVWGTPLAPTKFEEVVSEDLKTLRVREQRQTFRSLDIRKDAEYETKDGGEGSFTIELNYREQLRLWEHLFGQGASANQEVGREQHTFTLTDDLLAGKGLSVEIGRDVQAVRFEGCKIMSCRFVFAPDVNGQAEITLVAEDGAPVSATAPSFPDVSRYVAGHQTIIKIDDAARSVDSAEATIDNALDGDKRVLGLKTIDEPIRGDAQRIISGTFTADGTAGDWSNFLANTDFKLEILHVGPVLVLGTYVWDLLFNACRIIGAPHQVTGPGIVKSVINWEARIPAGGGALGSLTVENEDAAIA